MDSEPLLDSGETSFELNSGRGHAARDQQRLWSEVLSMARYVESALRSAIEAVCLGRLDLVGAVRSDEKTIDQWEVRIEEACLRVLALYGVVASDLRRVAAALRINRELEGLADIAENLAKRAGKLNQDPAAAPFLPKLRVLANQAFDSVSRSLVALNAIDADQARQVMSRDATVNQQRIALVEELKDAVRNSPERVNTWLRLINSARNLERAADHACEIAAAVIYVKEGVMVRSHLRDGSSV